MPQCSYYGGAEVLYMIDYESIKISTWSTSPQWWRNMVNSMKGEPRGTNAMIKAEVTAYLQKHGMGITWSDEWPDSWSLTDPSVATISTTTTGRLSWLILTWA